MRIPVCLSLFALAGALALPAQAQQEKSFDTPYYPLQVGNRWTYRAVGQQKQQVVVEVEKREPIKVEFKDRAGAKASRERIITYVLKMTSGDKVMSEQIGVLPAGTYKFQPNGKESELAGGVYRLQAAGQELDPPECVLKLPLTKGDEWEVNCLAGANLIKGKFAAGEAAVQVPAGTFQTMTVASKDLQVGTQPLSVELWFAPQVGVVRQRIQIGTFQTNLELEKFEPAK